MDASLRQPDGDASDFLNRPSDQSRRDSFLILGCVFGGVPEHSIFAGHFAATAARIAASEGQILILQDTTQFIYSRAQPAKIGFAKTVNAGRYKAGQPNKQTLCRTLMHSSIAVTLAGTSLGLTPVKFWTRNKFKETLAINRIDASPTRPRLKTPTLAAYLLQIAMMGGYPARTNDLPPGNIVVWRGMTRLHGIPVGSQPRCG